MSDNTRDIINLATVANAVTINGFTSANSAGAGTLSKGGVSLRGDAKVCAYGPGLAICAVITDGGGTFGITKLGGSTVTLSNTNKIGSATRRGGV